MSTKIVVTTEADTKVFTTTEQLPVTVIESAAVESQIIATAGAQGPAGRDGKDGIDGEDGKDGKDGKDGIDGSPVSNKPKNRLTKEADGLYVSNDLSPDPLAYYILAKN